MNDFLNFLATGWYWILIAIVGLIILVKFIPRYKIAPPDTALIISGLIRRNYKVRNPDGTVSSKKFGYRIVRGGATFYIPAIERIDQLQQQAAGIRAQLDVLEQERKSKGFFNFAEKREVKDRMAPYEEELSQINSQIRSIERERENAIEGILRELGSGYTRMKF